MQPSDRNRQHALEQALAKDLRDPPAWAVYADFLQGFMPELGERIILELTRDTSPPEARRRLQLACRDLDHKHRREWVGPELARLFDKRGKTAAGLEIDWRYGFVARARVLGRSELPRKGPELDVILAALLGSPMSRFMTSLTLAVRNSERPQFTRALEHLYTLEARPTLTHLKLASRELAVELDRVLAALPSLERLELSQWAPAVDRLGVLLRHASLAKLEHLSLSVPHRGDALVNELTHSGRLAQLTQLGITRSQVSHVGVAQLIKHAADFTRLERLDLRQNEITREWADALARALPQVRVSAQLFPYDGKREPGLPSLDDD